MKNARIEIAKSFFFRRKMVFIILPIVWLTILLSGVVMCYISFKTLENETKAQLIQIADLYASDVYNKFYTYFEIGKYHNNIIQNFKAIDVNDRRRYFKNLSRAFLENDTSIRSVWVVFDRNALDGLDDNFRNSEYSATGRFNLGWYRSDADSELKLQFNTTESEANEDQDDYLRLPRELREAVITEPTHYSFNEEEATLVTSICFPVFDDSSNVVAVSGIDISLQDIVALIKDQNPYGISYTTLISPNHMILSHPISLLVGKEFKNAPAFQTLEWDYIRKNIETGEHFSLDFVDKTINQRKIVHYMPVRLGTTHSYLTLEIVFFYDEVMGNAKNFIWDIAMYFGIAMIIITIVIIVGSIILYNFISRNVSVDELDTENCILF